jgi:hypothetical protein
MVQLPRDDYARVRRMVFSKAPAFEQVMASIDEIERSPTLSGASG